MRVSRESNFSTIESDVEKLVQALEQISGMYSEGISEANSVIGGVSFGNWADSLSIKIEDFFNNVVIKTVDTVDGDIQNGSFSVLKQTVNTLKGELGKCDSYKTQINSLKEKLSDIPATVSKWKNPDWRFSYQGGTGGTGEKVDVPNPEYDSLQEEITGLEGQLDTYIANCNILFEKLESIKFNDGSVVATISSPIIFMDETDTHPEEREAAIEAYMRSDHNVTESQAEKIVDARAYNNDVDYESQSENYDQSIGLQTQEDLADYYFNMWVGESTHVVDEYGDEYKAVKNKDGSFNVYDLDGNLVLEDYDVSILNDNFRCIDYMYSSDN